MSEYGFVVKNNIGFGQIDGEYKNLIAHEQGSYYYDVTGSEQKVSIEYDTIATEPTLFAYRPVIDYYTNMYRMLIDNGEYTGYMLLSELEADGTLDWVAFTSPPVSAIPNYGMLVKNSKGDLVFSSAEKNFKIKSITDLQFTSANGKTINGLNVTDNYFFVTEHTPVSAGALYWPRIKKLSASSIRFAFVNTSGFPITGTYSGAGQLIEIGI